jgi:ferredoxin-type protein NapH
MNTSKNGPFRNYLMAPLITALVFTFASLFFAFVLKDPSPVPVFIIFAIIQVVCMTLFAILKGNSKKIARSVSILLIGIFLFVMAGILGRTNFQLEGFFFYLFSGTMSGVIVHFAMAKIIGPLLYNRAWCSWGCWSSMIFNLLPFKQNNTFNKKLSYLRYYHFALSVILVAVLFFVFNYSIANTKSQSAAGSLSEMIWFLAGNGLYYVTGILLAFTFKDNRAFCKYICPLVTLYKLSSKYALLRIRGNGASCTQCKACSKNCPMGIDISNQILTRGKFTSTECIMCLNCIAQCPNGVLKV